ncbi:MAG: UDP-N-acetylenolpyruvoylglucosamine reductase [Candidatus Kerfeldbacteria bacterium RIFCSPHIGHO2_12_FULL_48_17]|uniref:UDP-N-acetylenolpyruvoylglucosamine reductase n=1 Tax=Candidatus Kerfeldbacteria bacterium RIFCSPHIGHO2_12_FULL_48_17 TaxID=1798542 RepID=A0A1G2AY66_9BACT|nr:MAG: UDP-N-acetylenolpyruvoylglucosamine reductase [Candidatus Kerfeldbacteria bacterium RIFCSPHIGHO2_12_FULL_48_17]
MSEKKLNLPDLRENVPLAPLTTMKVGGPARYFLEAKTTESIVQAVHSAQESGIPYVMLGGGSNVLISDEGFRGLVIRTKNVGYEFRGEKLVAEAGVPLITLVMQSAKRNLLGLEWAAGIPGTLGGAVRGNAGSMGSDMQAIIDEVEILTRDGAKKTLSNKECEFAYRNSRIKKNKETVLQATLKLRPGKTGEAQDKVKQNFSKKHSSQDLKHPSCGCMFTNPLPQHAGRLLEEAGLKGFQIGGAKVSDVHANFIINDGTARAEDIVILISAIKQKIRVKFGVQLHEEVQYIGFD